VRNQDEEGLSSGAGRNPSLHRDPFYALSLQVERLAKIFSRKHTYIWYADITWMVEQGRMSQYLFGIERLTCDGSSLGDCSDELWNSHDSVEMYKSYLRGDHHYIQGELTKARSLTVESRLLHYLIAYILVYRNNNHAQPTINDLKLMFAIKEGIMVMGVIFYSSSRLLAYRIFLSCVIDRLGIDASDVEIMVVYPIEHLVGDNLINKMGIYKYVVVWKYQEDHNTTMNIDLISYDEKEEDDICEQKHGQQSVGWAQFKAMLRSITSFQQTLPDLHLLTILCDSNIE
ncbi:hypothetical protein Lal_00021062, partial [Lupinus albus]